jgi:2-methylaconitate cis-trans-isomerase PrpF
LGRIADEIERLRSIAAERMDLFRQAASKVEEADALLLAFVAAYEQQDTDNFTDAMRNVYAAADLFVSGTPVGGEHE